jgi:hypothetical protein
MVWTRFMDMHSGGGCKEPPYEKILIEAPESEARVIFYNRFGHNPDRVTCTCCGNDYSIDQSDDLAQATGFDRNCEYAYFDADGNEVPESNAWKSGVGMINGATAKYVERVNTKYTYRCNYVSLDEYLARKDVLVIRATDIKEEERVGEVPVQGYVYI